MPFFPALEPSFGLYSDEESIFTWLPSESKVCSEVCKRRKQFFRHFRQGCAKVLCQRYGTFKVSMAKLQRASVKVAGSVAGVSDHPGKPCHFYLYILMLRTMGNRWFLFGDSLHTKVLILWLLCMDHGECIWRQTDWVQGDISGDYPHSPGRKWL